MITEAVFPTLIAEATRMRGDLTLTGSAHVFGVVEGDVTQAALEPLQIGRSGWIHGNIESQGAVVVEGKVDGDIRSATKIQLLPSATVQGNLLAPVIEIRPGAIVEGGLSMSQARPVSLPGRHAQAA